jgi:hypothetical protein
VKPSRKKARGNASIGVRQRMIEIMYDVIHTDKEVWNKELFAYSLKTTPAAINRWENKKGFPTLDNVCDTIYIYGYSEEWVISGTGPKKKAGHTEKKFTIAQWLQLVNKKMNA